MGVRTLSPVVSFQCACFVYPPPLRNEEYFVLWPPKFQRQLPTLGLEPEGGVASNNVKRKKKQKLKKKNTRKRNSRAIGITPNPDTPTPSAVSTLPAHTHIMLAKLTWPLIGPSTWVSIINGIPCVPFISVCCCWLEDVEYTDRQSADSSLSHLATYLIAAYPLVYLFCSSILLSWPFLLRFPAFFAVQNQYK